MFLYASIWDASYIDNGNWTGKYDASDAPYVCRYKDIHAFAAVSAFARNYRFPNLDLSIYVRTFRVWMVNYPMIGIED
ncbi:hypothetical protein K1719_021502 [Acacia pycnantha]|nr:hypothetical protein K1719_021502 [Acacia pycnantha]